MRMILLNISILMYFPMKKSVLVKNLGLIDFSIKLPFPYCDYPEFNLSTIMCDRVK